MKKIFALFCAIFLMPSFSAQAWIGGPFSGNAFFGETGADGIYEAIATAVNGIGLYRITVGNEFQGVGAQQLQFTGDAASTVTAAGNVGRPIDFSQVKSGNVVIGSFGSIWSNMWYYQGVSYRGRTMGTANFAAGEIMGIGEAYSVDVVNPRATIQTNVIGGALDPNTIQDLTPVAFLSSGFKASISTSGKLIGARTFRGIGQARLRFTDVSDLGRVTPRPQRFQFTVFGSKVSDNIFLGL